jgi:predicted ATPase/DNA-binding SARP family transcriptional activator
VPPPRLLLFGPPRLAGAGGADELLPKERRHQLVAWLALKRTWVGRPELAALLWPEQESKLAFTNLRKAVHRLQGSALAGALQLQGQSLRLEAHTDVAEFEAALAAGRLAEAVALQHAELLAGYDDDANEPWTSWLQHERERLRSAWHAAALAQLQHLEAKSAQTPAQTGGASAGGQAASLQPAALEAVALSTRLLASDPLDEAALAAHLRALARAGQAGAAREAYRTFVARLRSELGLEPPPALSALQASLLEVRAGDAPAVAGIDARAGAAGEPTEDTAGRAGSEPAIDPGFVGRGAEIRRITELLALPDCAMLALLGPGGIGKTRLARHALHALAPRFANGATFVSLEDATSRAEVGPRLAAALDLALAGTADALAEVRHALRHQRRLVVLDNFEALAEDAAWLEALQRDCPHVKVLLTSRVRPLAAGVWTMPVEGLPCPEPEDIDRFEAFDAVRLFVRSARRVDPTFNAAGEAAAIVDICRQVQGMPLALELAASFTRVLPCAAIATELREGTELLRVADPARPARQASLEVIFEQSWRRLVPAEREALARLAVFRGGFTLAAARSVAAASLPVLASLTDKSLLRKETGAQGARCHLHPLVQQLALAKLDGELEPPSTADAPAKPGVHAVREATREAHARHHLRLLADRHAALALAERDAMREIDLECENITAAWRWALAHGATDDLARAALALADYSDHRGRWREGLALLHEALVGAGPAPAGAHASNRPRASMRARAPLGAAAALLESRLDRYAEAEALAAEALAQAREHGDTNAELRAVVVRAGVRLRTGRLDEARSSFHEALALAERLGDARIAAGSLTNLSLVERSAGNIDAALELTLRALPRHRAAGDVRGEALALNNQGWLRVARGDMAGAREVLLAGQRLCTQHGLPAVLSFIESNLADLALDQGDLAAAEAHARQSLALSLACGQRATAAEGHHQLMLIALRRGQLDAARREVAAAGELVADMDRPGVKVQAAYHFALLLAAQGERIAAAHLMAFVLQAPSIAGRARADGEAIVRAGGGPFGEPWHGPSIDALLGRIVHEAAEGHAALVAELRAGGSASRAPAP